MIEHAEVQGNVLYAYGDAFRHARYVLFRIDDPVGAREQLRRWFSHITFGRRPWRVLPNGDLAKDVFGERLTPPAELARVPHLNIAFTFEGLKRLAVPNQLLYAFPPEFCEGARSRALDNGDSGASDARNWVDGLGTGHVLVTIHATEGRDRDEFADRVLSGSERALSKMHDLRAARLKTLREPVVLENGIGRSPLTTSCDVEYDREHFGFADGCSQPSIEGVHDDPTGTGVYAVMPPRWWRPLQPLELLLRDLGVKPVRRHWRGLRVGEFLLGYEDEDGRLPLGPPAPLGPGGTFMVYRPMRQNVEAFDSYVEDEARRVGLDAQLLRAKIVGRWPDGTPLTLSPDRPNAVIATNRRRANDFLYQQHAPGYPGDPNGYACPFGAHIRRSFPRDGLPGGSERSMRHRIIRRGMPYGQRDEEDRGLAFVCFSSSISDGFEFIQRRWLSRGQDLGFGDDADLLLQQEDENQRLTGMVIPQPVNRNLVLRPPPRAFVTVRGCEYLFVPSRTAYLWLSNLR